MNPTMTYKKAAQRGRGLRQAGFDFRQQWICEGCRTHNRLTNWVVMEGRCRACGHKTNLRQGGSTIEVIDNHQRAIRA
jgi:hypothetical protein